MENAEINTKVKNIMTEDRLTDFEKICDFGNLYEAYRKAKSGKGYSISRANLWIYLLYSRRI